LLRELQHRVKNNLQMITALIRLEARTLPDDNATTEAFDRLAGRIEALAVLYRALAEEGAAESIDLGIYLSEVASAVMRSRRGRHPVGPKSRHMASLHQCCHAHGARGE
jgi:two-component sensor histidine kinase